MRTFLRFLSRLLGSRPRRPTTRRPDYDAEIRAAQHFMSAAARTDMPGLCLLEVARALLELSKTLPNDLEEDVP